MPSPAATQMPVMIQYRITIVISAQPLSWKWCCYGAILKIRLPPEILK